MITSPRSGRRHKAWGVSPRINRRKNSSLRSGRQPIGVNVAPTARAVARSAGSLFRNVRIPGVPLRFTPGFTLSCAPRTEHQVSQLYDYRLDGLLSEAPDSLAEKECSGKPLKRLGYSAVAPHRAEARCD